MEPSFDNPGRELLLQWVGLFAPPISEQQQSQKGVVVRDLVSYDDRNWEVDTGMDRVVGVCLQPDALRHAPATHRRRHCAHGAAASP
jgi:hypothetical protein